MRALSAWSIVAHRKEKTHAVLSYGMATNMEQKLAKISSLRRDISQIAVSRVREVGKDPRRLRLPNVYS